MNSPGMFLRSGKVKDIYQLDDGHLVFSFTDRVSAFDVVLPSTIPRKGEVLCNLAAYWFQNLGVRHHMERLDGSNRMVVKKLEMIPVECVVRGYLYGSLYERVMKGELPFAGDKEMAAKLRKPIFDPTTKSDLKDEPITEAGIVKERRMSEEELATVRDESISIYNKMSVVAGKAGFILADLKLEFGKDADGRVVLADSIGPDEFRLWPADSYQVGRLQESYDKQPVRDWLSSVGYRSKLESSRKTGSELPPAPDLPQTLILEVSKRYLTAYERLTGRPLG